MDTIEWPDFEKVWLVAGTVLRVVEFPEARKPAYKIWVDFGAYGDRKQVLKSPACISPRIWWDGK